MLQPQYPLELGAPACVLLLGGQEPLLHWAQHGSIGSSMAAHRCRSMAAHRCKPKSAPHVINCLPSARCTQCQGHTVHQGGQPANWQRPVPLAQNDTCVVPVLTSSFLASFE